MYFITIHISCPTFLFHREILISRLICIETHTVSKVKQFAMLKKTVKPHDRNALNKLKPLALI